jgi:hypothetical protein
MLPWLLPLEKLRATWRPIKCKKPLVLLVPVERIELPTFGLQNRCSTAELNRLKAIDRIGVGKLAADRIWMPQRPGSVYGGRLGRVNRRIPAKPLSGRGVATRLGDCPGGAGTGAVSANL